MTRVLLRVVCFLVFGFLLVPLLIVFPLSFSSAPFLQFPPPGFSLQWYERYLDDPVWISATVRSFKIAAATVALSLIIGLPLTFSLVRGRYPGRAVLDQLMATPMIVPTIVTSIAIYGLFVHWHLVGTWYGLAIAHTLLALPFVMIVCGAGLRGLDRSLEHAAEGLGASAGTVMRRIILPQMGPSLISAAVLAFITSFDEVVVALFLAGTQMTLPKKMFDNIRMEIDPTIAAVSVLQILLIAVTLGIVTVFNRGRHPIAG